MSWFAELLPLFILRWWAERNCERYQKMDTGVEYTCPRPGVFIEHRKSTEERREGRRT